MEERLACELWDRKKGSERRRRPAHNGLILTFLWGPVLPVSFQMNGNCPAGFNHVLNWQKNRRKALLRQLRIDRSGSRPIATPLYPPHHTRTHTLLHTNAQTDTCTPMSEQVTEALITVMARWREEKKWGREGWRTGEKWRWWESWAVGHWRPSWPQCQLWQQTERRIIVSSRVRLPSLPLLSTNKAPFNI